VCRGGEKDYQGGGRVQSSVRPPKDGVKGAIRNISKSASNERGEDGELEGGRFRLREKSLHRVPLFEHERMLIPKFKRRSERGQR